MSKRPKKETPRGKHVEELAEAQEPVPEVSLPVKRDPSARNDPSAQKDPSA